MDYWSLTSLASQMVEGSSSPSGAGINVVARTWERDSHDLFDFEASQVQRQTFVVDHPAKFFRNGSDVKAVLDTEQAPADADHLLRVVKRSGSYFIDKCSVQSAKKLWVVVKDLGPGGHTLSEGDVMKLGRVKLRIKQIVTEADSDKQPDVALQESVSVCTVEADHEEKLASTTCRICLLEGSTEDDPLIRPCQCKGSIAYVHLGCQRNWAKGRQNLGDSTDGSFKYRPLPCELCKTSLPSTLVMPNGKAEPFIDMPKTKAPFIVLEHVSSRDARGRGQVEVVSFAERQLLKFGRGHESCVRIQDVSISRCHATIRWKEAEGKFILEDNNSKFGTLVLMKKPQAITADTTLSVQAGRSVVSLSLSSAAPVSGPRAVYLEDAQSQPAYM